MNNKKSMGLASVVAVVLFLLSLIPILYIARYSHPVFDDYSYSEGVRKVVLEGGNAFKIIGASFEKVADTYRTWQGTYSAIFLFALQPGVYKTSLYWITAFIILGSIAISNLILGAVVSKRVLNARGGYGLILALIITEFQIQFAPYIKESFYWYNGGMYYGFFYALEVLEIAFLILIWKDDNALATGTFALLLGGFISGGNYSNALTNVMFCGLALLLSLLFQRKKVKVYLPLFVFILIAFVISIAAPGNANRANNYAQLSALDAIWQSIKYAAESALRWTRLAQVGLILFLVAFSYRVLKEAKCSFKYPLVVLVISFGIFAAQFTPPFYAMGNQGSLRQINMYYYSYYALLAFDVIYLEGWIVKHIGGLSKKSDRISLRFTGTILICSVILMMVGVYTYGLKNTTFVTTYLDIKSGRAQRYDQQYREKEGVLLNATGEIYIDDISEYPSTFYNLGLYKEGEVGYWINESIARYYGLSAVYLKDE